MPKIVGLLSVQGIYNNLMIFFVINFSSTNVINCVAAFLCLFFKKLGLLKIQSLSLIYFKKSFFITYVLRSPGWGRGGGGGIECS